MKYWITRNGVEIYKVLRGRCNGYLITNSKGFLLIDAGRTGAWQNLERALGNLGLKNDSPIALMLSHCHFDHAENAARFKKTYNASIIVHRNEGEYLNHGKSPHIVGTLFATQVLSRLLSATKWPDRLRYKPANYDVLVDERLALDPFGVPGYILHTPGHSPGSISAIIDNDIAIVGDAMFGVFAGSVFPPFAEDVPSLIRSWKKLLDTGCRIFLPGHGSERCRDTLKRQYDKYRKL